MKKLKIITQTLLLAVFMICSLVNVSAGDLTLSVSKAKPTIGSTFTVKVNAAGLAGKFSFSCSSNLKMNKTSEWIENSSTTISVTALSEGPGTITVKTENVSTTDSSPQEVSMTKTANVTVVNVAKPETPQPGKPTQPGKPNQPDTRSGDNTLASLNVSQGTLSPVFKSETTHYTVNLNSGVSEVTLNAKANHAKAKVSGTGMKTVKPGENKFSIVCTAENGAKKYYSVNLVVDDAPTIFIDYNNSQLGFVTIINNVKAPQGFEKSQMKVNDKEVNCWINHQMNLTVVYLVDESGNKDFYMIEDGAIVRKLEILSVQGKNYVIVDMPSQFDESGFTKQNVQIKEKELTGWTYLDETMSDYCIVYLMNESGEKAFYSYEKTEGTLQKYKAPKIVEEKKEIQPIMVYILAGTTVYFAVISLVSIMTHIRFKKKSIAAIKDYYESKNQVE